MERLSMGTVLILVGDRSRLGVTMRWTAIRRATSARVFAGLFFLTLGVVGCGASAPRPAALPSGPTAADIVACCDAAPAHIARRQHSLVQCGGLEVACF